MENNFENVCRRATLVFYVVYGVVSVAGLAWLCLQSQSMIKDAFLIAYIATGVVMLLSMAGCFAAATQSFIVSIVCASVLLLLAVIQIRAAISATSDFEKFSAWTTINEAWRTSEMDAIQNIHKCCGKIGYTDYLKEKLKVPASCFNDNIYNSQLKHVYKVGCVVKVRENFDMETMHFLTASWGFILLTIFGFVLTTITACCFFMRNARLAELALQDDNDDFRPIGLSIGRHSVTASQMLREEKERKYGRANEEERPQHSNTKMQAPKPPGQRPIIVESFHNRMNEESNSLTPRASTSRAHKKPNAPSKPSGPTTTTITTSVPMSVILKPTEEVEGSSSSKTATSK